MLQDIQDELIQYPEMCLHYKRILKQLSTVSQGDLSEAHIPDMIIYFIIVNNEERLHYFLDHVNPFQTLRIYQHSKQEFKEQCVFEVALQYQCTFYILKVLQNGQNKHQLFDSLMKCKLDDYAIWVLSRLVHIHTDLLDKLDAEMQLQVTYAKDKYVHAAVQKLNIALPSGYTIPFAFS